MGFVPLTPREREDMCRAVGVSSTEELWKEIPEDLLLREALDLPAPLTELELRRELELMGEVNLHLGKAVSFLGGGMADHFIPSVVDEILRRPEFYTAYTPYQAEVSQGTLQTIYEYQTMIARLTGMDVSNASVHDGPTALAEAVLMAVGATGRRRVLVSSTLGPSYIGVLRTYAGGGSFEIDEVPFREGLSDVEALARRLGPQVAAAAVARPNFFGLVEEPGDLGENCERAGALLVVVTEPISLALLSSPGELGAHIAVGDGQPLGNPLSLGGPTFGFLACRRELVRRLPGRLVGRTADAGGKAAYVLTLQTREQHIRRERATSNICTNSALGALAGAVYLAALGRDGFPDVARQCLQKSHYAADLLAAVPGVRRAFSAPFFKEFALRIDGPARPLLEYLAGEGFLAGPSLEEHYPELAGSFLVCVTESRTRRDIDRLGELTAAYLSTRRGI